MLTTSSVALWLVFEPGAASDRVERLVRQTRFLAAAFRDFERRSAECGEDEHLSCAHRLLAESSDRPYRHAVLTVTDESFEFYGMNPADWDLLTRIPRLEALDVVVTDRMLAGALHERIHRMLPGIEEVRRDETPLDRKPPVLVIPPGGGVVHVARDREEEVAGVARRVKLCGATRHAELNGQAALIVRQRLPYVYVAREVLRSAGVTCQMFDALLLVAEPFAAALDLVLSCVSTDFARVPAMALPRSPHFRFGTGRDVSALDRALAEAGYSGGVDSLERLLCVWRQAERTPVQLKPATPFVTTSVTTSVAKRAISAESRFSRSRRSYFDRLHRLLNTCRCSLRFCWRTNPLRCRRRPGAALARRSAVLATLNALRDAYARFDSRPVSADDVAAPTAMARGQTFAPLTGDDGVHPSMPTARVLENLRTSTSPASWKMNGRSRATEHLYSPSSCASWDGRWNLIGWPGARGIRRRRSGCRPRGWRSQRSCSRPTRLSARPPD